MSKWIKVPNNHLELSKDKETVDVYLGGDEEGSQYLELDANYLKELLAKGGE